MSARPLWQAMIGLVTVASASCSGQSVTLSGPTAFPGEYAAIDMTLETPSKAEVLALEWEAVIPFQQLDIDTDRMMRLTVALQDAGKSLHCAVLQAASVATLRCIVAGGVKRIPAGLIGIISTRISDTAAPGPLKIRLQNVVGVGRNLEKLRLDDAEATVTVRRR